MIENKTFAIIGLGLLGGSIAKCIKNNISHARLIGITGNKDLLLDEQAKKIFDHICSDIKGAKNADIIIIATPIRAIIANIAKLKKIVHQGTIITDVGSVKRNIMNAATILPDDVCFVGGHPMAGSHLSGFKHSSAGLFCGVNWIVCESKNKEANETIIEMIEALEANPVIIDAETHDRFVAATSHLPHVIASTLASYILSCGDEYKQFLATGFLDTTRIAASDPILWEEIINNNKDNIIEALNDYQQEISKWQKAIKENDSAQLTALLSRAKTSRESIGKKTR